VKDLLKLVSSAAGALLCAGCYSLTSFQSPEVLEPRPNAVGAGPRP